MSIKLQLPQLTDLKPRIVVIGVGGAGGNAINNMIASGLKGVDFVVANTDAQALASSSAEHRIQLGVNLTEGLGAGSKPEIGEAAAEEARDDIHAQVAGAHMVFIAAGMGGGTGTGAAGVIARIAKEAGILTVAIVTKPFQFEGARRLRMAEAGIGELAKHVDTLIVIPNQNLFRVANERTTFAEAFVLADQVLYSGIACIVDLIVKEGLINLDFADVRTVLSGMGTAMMGTGEAAGERRAIAAAEEAIFNPLLDDISLKGARGLLLSITGGRGLTLYEIDEAASRVRQEVDNEANIIVGATFDDTLEDRVRVSIVASGMTLPAAAAQRGAAVPFAPIAAHHDPRPAASPPPSSGDGRVAKVLAEAAAQPAPAEPAARHHVHAAPPPARPPAPSPQRPPVAAREPATVEPQPADADILAHVLSQALREQNSPAQVPAAREAEAAGGRPRPGWQSPDGVVVEESLPRQAGYATPPPLPRTPPAAGRWQDEPLGSSFQPAAPQVPPRATSRQMPTIDDFPEVGQRDWRSKSTTGDAQPPARRRPSFLERLAGAGWRESESDGGEPRNDPQGERGRADGTAHRGSSAPQHATATGVSHGSNSRGQEAELPQFFDKKRR